MDYRQLSRGVFGLPGHPLDDYTKLSANLTVQGSGVRDAPPLGHRQ